MGGDRGRGNGQGRIIPGTGCGDLWGVQDEGRRGFIYPERGGCNLSLTDERRGNRVLEKWEQKESWEDKHKSQEWQEHGKI